MRTSRFSDQQIALALQQVKAILQLWSDESLRSRLEHGDRKTAEQHYSWDVIGPETVARYRDLLPSRG